MTWAKTRLRYVAALNPAAPEWVTSQPDDEFSFLPMEAIGEDASIRLDQTRPVNAVRSGYSFFEDGDVAFAKVTPCFENGKAAVMSGLTGGAGFGTTEITVARPNNKILNRFLFYVLTDDTFRQLGKSAMTGAGGLRRVPDHFTKDYSFLLPSTDKQQEIVSYLDGETAQIDDLIGKQERLIELLAEKRQAVITQAVIRGLDSESPTKPSGIPWLGDVNTAWPIRPLKAAGEINLGKMIQPLPKVTGDFQAPYLRAANVQPDGVLTIEDVKEMWFNKRDLASLDVLAGDVVVVEGGIGGFGRAAFVDKDLAGFGYQNSINRIRPNQDVDGRFLTYLLLTARQSGFIHAYCTGVSMPHLTAEKLAAIRVPLPDRVSQSEICDFLDRRLTLFAQLSSKASKVISVLQERRSALISAAVTGTIYVREGVA